MQDDLDARLRDAFQSASGFRSAIQELKQQARERPEELAAHLAWLVPEQMEEWRCLAVEHFGVNIANRGEVAGFVERAPLPPRVALVFCTLTSFYDAYWMCLYQMAHLASEHQAGRIDDEAFAEGVCRKYVQIVGTSLPAAVVNNYGILYGKSSDAELGEKHAETLAAYISTRVSLAKNIRLRAAIDDAREHKKPASRERFEQLLRELYVEAPSVWRELRTKSHGLDDLRRESARRIEKPRSSKKDELRELAAFADRQALLQRGREAGLAPREYEVFKLFVENSGIKYREVADKLGISVGAVSKMMSRIKKALAETA